MRSNIIAIIFDFDDTLAPDSTSGYLKENGIDISSFWNQKVKNLLDEGWDTVSAYFYLLIEESKKNDHFKLTKKSLMSWGEKLNFFPGVTEIFDHLKDYTQKKHSVIELEFYLISSGIREILINTAIKKHFKDIWASDFAYDREQNVTFPKNIVSFTDKTRYLFHIQKGFWGNQYRNKPFSVNKKISKEEIRIPFENMVFVGDGYTDIPCFSLIDKSNGIALGVVDRDSPNKWWDAMGFKKDNRVLNVTIADYQKGSEARKLLEMAIDSISYRITLQRDF